MTKNQEWKQSGTKLSFKDWLRSDLNQSVQSTVQQMELRNHYMNIDGQDGGIDTFGYKPTLSGQTILGIPIWAFYSIAAFVVVAVAVTAVSGNKKTEEAPK
jgi:hypothetical protein